MFSCSGVACQPVLPHIQRVIVSGGVVLGWTSVLTWEQTPRSAEGSVLFCWDDGGPVLHLSQLLLLTCGFCWCVLTRSPRSVDLEIIPTDIPPWPPHSRTTSFSKTDSTFHKPRSVCRLSRRESFLLAVCLRVFIVSGNEAEGPLLSTQREQRCTAVAVYRLLTVGRKRHIENVGHTNRSLHGGSEARYSKDRSGERNKAWRTIKGNNKLNRQNKSAFLQNTEMLKLCISLCWNVLFL